MQLILFLGQIKIDRPLFALRAPCRPLVQQLAHPEHARHTGDQHVEIARTTVHQRCHLHQAVHQTVRIDTALEVNCDFQTGQIALVAQVGDFADFSRLDQIGNLIDDRLNRRRVRNFRDLNNIFLFQMPPLCAHLKRAASGLIDLLHLRPIENNLAACRKVRRRKGLHQVAVRIAQECDFGPAHLVQVKAAERARHADRNAGVRRDQNIREGRRQQCRLLHLAVVVVHKVDRIAVDLAEQLRTDFIQLRLGIAGCGVCHIARIHLAEVALGIDKRGEQRLIAARQTHHGLVNCTVAVRIELHSLSDDVGGLGAVLPHQSHLIHGIQQFPVGRLESVDLRNRTRDNDTHRIRHIVLAQSLRNALIGRLERMIFFFRLYVFLFRHSFLASYPIRRCRRHRDTASRSPQYIPFVPRDCHPKADQTSRVSDRYPPA